MAKKPFICGDFGITMPECGKDDQQDARLDALEECCAYARQTLANHASQLADHDTRISNNASAIQNIISNLSNYYTKAETYNKDEVNNLISRFLSIRKVNQLPATGEDNVIYLVPKDWEEPDIHDEYIWQDGRWELIGTTQIDLSDYYTKSETDTLLNLKQNKLTAGTNIQINGDTISATDTKYTAGTGLSLSGTVFNHSNSVSALATQGLRKIAYDAQGHITGSSAVVKKDITDLGIPAEDTNTTYSISKSGNTVTLTGSDGATSSFTDKDTTYSAGTGLSMSGTTINHSNSVTALATASLKKIKYDAQGHITGVADVTKSDITALGIPGENTDTKYTATKENIGSASGWSRGTLPTLGTAISADDITAWDAGSTPTLGTAISADDITAWDAGTLPTLGTAISTDDITNWSAGTAATSAISAGGLTLNDGTAPSLSYTAKSIPNVTGVGSLPSLSYTSRSIPNVTNVGTKPSLSYTSRSIPNVTGVGSLPSLTVTTKSVVTDITAS